MIAGFISESNSAGLDALDEVLEKNFECKTMPRIGPQKFGGQTVEGKSLSWRIGWEEQGLTWTHNDKLHQRDCRDPQSEQCEECSYSGQQVYWREHEECRR